MALSHLAGRRLSDFDSAPDCHCSTNTLRGQSPFLIRERHAEALAQVQRNWLVKLRTEKELAQAINFAGAIHYEFAR